MNELRIIDVILLLTYVLAMTVSIMAIIFGRNVVGSWCYMVLYTAQLVFWLIMKSRTNEFKSIERGAIHGRDEL